LSGSTYSFISADFPVLITKVVEGKVGDEGGENDDHQGNIFVELEAIGVVCNGEGL